MCRVQIVATGPKLTERSLSEFLQEADLVDGELPGALGRQQGAHFDGGGRRLLQTVARRCCLGSHPAAQAAAGHSHNAERQKRHAAPAHRRGGTQGGQKGQQ